MEKQYLDYEGFEHTIERLRRKEMPEPGLDYVGQIVQYVGSTTSDYVKGYYYECVSDGETPATYSWVQRNIQPKEKAGTRLNVLDYGLVNDGTTDNKGKLKTMLESIPDYSTVYFPKGVYLIGMNSTMINLPKGITLVGDGEYETKLKFVILAENDRKHGLIMYGDSTDGTDFEMSDIGFELEINEGDVNTTKDPNLLIFKGQYNDLKIHDVYGHIGGNASSLPGSSLIWLKCGVDTFDVHDCLFEDFTNNQLGGCIWSSARDDVASIVYHVGNFNVHNNEFRGTNSDEMVGLMTEQSADNPGNRYDNVRIQDNIFIHKNWNGECHSTGNITSVNYNKDLEPAKSNIIISNNIYELEKCVYSVFKVIGYDGATVDGNIVRILSGSSSSTYIGPFEFRGCKDIQVINNKITYSGANPIQVRSLASDAMYKNNEWTADDGVQIFGNDYETTNEYILSFINNMVHGPLSINLRPEASPSLKVIITDNIFDSKLVSGGIKTNGRSVAVIRNVFNNLTEERLRCNYSNYAGGDFYFIDNKNVILSFYGVAGLTSETKFSKFVYVGDTAGLSINTGGDTYANRDYLYTTGSITYTDNQNYLNVNRRGVINVLDYGLTRNESSAANNSYKLQALINDIPEGSVVYFPMGVYIFKDPVIINKNVKFKGESELIKPTSWKVAVGSTRPESAIRFEPTEANKTLFSVEGIHSVLFYGLSFYAQTRDETTNLVPIHTHSSSKTDGIPFDGTLPYPVWTHSERIEGINGLDLSGANNEVGLTNISNCTFVGFSGFAVKIGQHRYIENCTFYHNNVCVDEAGTDGFVKNCWFCSSHIGILLSHEYFPTYCNVQVSSCWCDQMSGHFIYAPNVDASTVATIMLLIDDAWVDMIDGAAIYVEGQLHHSMISGRFSRCGMKWAGLTIDDRKTKVATLATRKELMPDSDVICARIFHNNFVNISCHKRAVGSQSNNSTGKCPSKVVGVFGNANRWADNTDVFHSNVVYSIGDFKTQNMVDGTLQEVPDTIFDDDDWFVARDSIFFSNNRVISRIVRSDFSNILATANMPTASADYVNKIVQYAGEETTNYKPGHFYACKAQGTDPETYAWESTDTVTNGMYKVYSGTYDSVEGEFYDADGNALPKVDKQQYYDIATRTTWIYYSAWSGFFRLFNDVVGMESSQMNSALMTEYYPELNAAHFRCMNVSGNDGGLIEGFIYKLDRMSVTPEAGDSPVNEGWWEVDSTTGKMIKTTDTEVVSSKLYFKYVWTQVKPQQSVFPGTLEEWNVLTEAEKAKYDFVATPEEADITGSYSTTETKTGATWIDGKPIYRKTITGTAPSTANTEKGFAIGAPVSTFVSISGFLPDPTNGVSYLLGQKLNENEWSTIWCRTNAHTSSPNEVVLKVSSALVTCLVEIIVEYTKTTD